jgi:Tol biopolymer transport system component
MIRKKNTLKGLSFIAVSLITACSVNTPTNNIIRTDNKAETPVKKSKTTITGQAEFPIFTPNLSDKRTDQLGNKFNTKANINDLISASTVSILYPSNHPGMANKTVATGLTTNNGEFEINPSSAFNPAENEIFILEAAKRTGDSKNPLITVRTMIQWKSTGWQSVTYPEIKINKYTTALSLISANSTGINPEEFINKIEISNGNNNLQDVNTEINVAMINNVVSLVNDVLLQDQDPAKYIGKEGAEFKIINNPEFSIAKPIGNAIIYANFGSNKVNLVDVDTQKTIDFSDTFEDEFFASDGFLTADRKKVIIRGYDRTNNNNIFSVNVNGGGLVNLTNSTGYDVNNLIASPDGSKFIYYKNNNFYLYKPSDGSTVNLTAGITGISSIHNAKISPDGNKAAFSLNANSRYEIYSVDFTNNNTRYFLTSGLGVGSGTDPNFIWSPNSNKIVFRILTTTAKYDIYTVDYNNTNKNNLSSSVGLNNEFYAYNNAFSPDSSKVYFKTQTSSVFPYAFNFSVKNADNSGPVINITPGLTYTSGNNNTNFVYRRTNWSPDSNKLGFTFYDGFRDSYYVSNIGSSSATLVKMDPPGSAHASDGFFSADSSKIVYRVTQSSRSDLYSANATGGGYSNLTSGFTGTFSFVEDADSAFHKGQKLFFKNSSDSNLYVMNSDGTGIISLNETNANEPVWLLNYTKIGYRKFTPAQNSYDIWMMNPDGSGKTNLTNTPDISKGSQKYFLQ